ADTLRQLALVLSEKGRFQEADVLFRASLETIRSIYGEGHVQVALKKKSSVPINPINRCHGATIGS
ncbi:MAG: hypothetical protein DRJ61_07065, partial [Acidobacteria bacterium]